MRDTPESLARETPARRPYSVRRTTSMELSWPQGSRGPVVVEGRGRDLVTLGSAAEVRLANEDHLALTLGEGKVIATIDAVPPVPGLERLAGAHAAIGFRRALAPLLQGQPAEARPIAVLLDDIVGCSIISGWFTAKYEPRPASNAVDRSSQENVCAGYATGSTALFDRSQIDVVRPVPRLQPADDPIAFHQLAPDLDGLLRRVRRIDLWRIDATTVGIDAMFQDSGVIGPQRGGVHEYRLLAEAADTSDGLVLKGITAYPGTLPYAECLGARPSVAALVGTPLAALRRQVLSVLKGAVGCTHLNDAARTLAEADALLAQLPPCTPE